MPEARGHHVLHGDRELPVGLVDLRQVGDAAMMAVGQADPTFDRQPFAGEQLEEGALAGAVGADHGQHVARPDLQLQMVNGWVMVIAHGDVVEADQDWR